MEENKKKQGLASMFIENKNHYVVTPLSKFLRTEFDYELFAQFQDRKIAWMFGSRGYMGFCYLFKQIIYLPQNEISAEFKELKYLLAYLENSVSELELLFYCETVIKFIEWNRKTNYEHIDLYINNFKVNELTNHNLAIFSLQLKAFINFVKSTNYQREIEIPASIVDMENKVLQPSKQSKIDEVKRIIAFLRGTDPFKKIPFTNQYELIERYTIELVEKGQVTYVPQKIPHVTIGIGGILYTYRLISEYLYGRKRNPHLLTFLIKAFEDFKDYESGKSEKVNLYKKFTDKPDYYDQYNKYIPQELLGISNPQ